MIGTPQSMKDLNKNLVENYLRQNSSATKPQIASSTGISLVTVTKLVNDLITEQTVIPCGINESTGGRKAQTFCINPSCCSIGIYYMKGYLCGFVCDAIGTILSQQQFRITESDARSIFMQFCHMIDTLITENNMKKISMIGIGIPGIVDHDVFFGVFSLPALNGYPLVAQLEEKYNTCVLADNDLNFAAIGFYDSRNNPDTKNVMLIYMQEGVGAGIILNGSLFRGQSSFAGELGYLPISIDFGAENDPPLFHNLEETVRLIHQKQRTDPDNTKWRHALNEAASKMILCAISFFSPDTIAICGPFDSADMKEIEKNISRAIGYRTASDIVVISDIGPYCMSGIACFCRESQFRSVDPQ